MVAMPNLPIFRRRNADLRCAGLISGLISAAQGFRDANRLPDDHEMLSVVPDHVHALLTDQDRKDLLTGYHIRVRSHTEEYGRTQ